MDADRFGMPDLCLIRACCLIGGLLLRGRPEKPPLGREWHSYHSHVQCTDIHVVCESDDIHPYYRNVYPLYSMYTIKALEAVDQCTLL